MQIKTFLCVFVAICAIHQISAFNFCSCKDKGIDVCSCKKGLTAPRPYPVQLPRLQKPLLKSICKEQIQSGPQQFKPIGDACHCGQQIVKPAPLPKSKPCLSGGLPKFDFNFDLPKPTCNCQSQSNPEPSYNSNNCRNAVRAPEQFQSFADDGATIYFETSRKKSAQPQKPKYAPADVVSVAIAKRLANSAKNGVSERQLQYGSLKDPIAAEKNDRKQSIIDEESFYDTKGSVLEIQPYIFKRQRDESSEEDSEEAKPKKMSNNEFNPAQLEFEEIGYKPYAPSSKPRYVVVKNSEPVKHECNKRQPTKHHHHHRKSQSCDCYKDLVVDQSAISEQSMSFESSNDHPFGGKFST